VLYMYCGETLLVDLETGESEEVELVEVEEAGPGLAAGLALYQKYAADDPLVIGSGLLAGTTAPASCLGFVLGKSPASGNLSLMPLNEFAGAEVKLSGFSFVVVKGRSKGPVYLWLHDGVADVHDASKLWGKDTWATTDWIRREMGEGLIQVISIGPAGEKKSPLASLGMNYWGGIDPGGLGALAGDKNLKAIAVRGLGMLDGEDPQAFYDATVALSKDAETFTGLGEVCAKAGAEDISGWLEPMVHRYRSCFACPSACGTFLKYNEDPSVVSLDGVPEPGFLLFDAGPALVLKDGGWEAEPAARALEAMAREGVDLLRGARIVATTPMSDAAALKDAISSLRGEPDTAWPGGEESPASIFASWPPTLAPADEWATATAMGYVLGICPVFIMTSGVPLDAFAALCLPAAGIEVTVAEIVGMIPPRS
jgi:aldehyde:ferredoxin oxidoreductase